jgi:two-component system, OmpR family, phosphate regulon sensor histidine kinase PhoR
LMQDLSHLHRLETVRRDFISNLSHELRTPLASIKALVDTLRDGAIEDPPAAEHFLERMEVEVDEMTQMVQELLELSRIESGQAPLRLFPTAITALVEPVMARLHTQAERANLTLNLVLTSELPEVMVDADRVRTVILNLVHNAIKFTPAGGYVTVSARTVPDTIADAVVISVADTGVGIPTEDVPRIFERFYKADRARSGGGTGLGLAIAKHTVQAHNGQIWVESTEDVGSTFSFTLPLVNLPLTKN